MGIANVQNLKLIKIYKLPRKDSNLLFEIFFKSNIKAYKLLLRLKGIDTKFPDDSTEVFFTGFQRSGNSYLSYLIREIYPGLSFVSHIHAHCALKLALRLGVPTFVLLRDPLDCICSSVAKRSVGTMLNSKALITRDLSYYSAYYSFVASNPDLYIISFDELVSAPHQLLEKISSKIGLEPASEERVKHAAAVVKTKLEKATEGRDPLDKNLRTEEKVLFKKKLISFFDKNSLYLECSEIFGELDERKL